MEVEPELAGNQGEGLGSIGAQFLAAAGGIGYFMMGYGYSTAAAALGVVLGKGLELNLRLGLNLVDGSFVRLLSRPITGTIVALSLVVISYGIYRQVKLRKKLATMTEDKPA